MEFVDASTRRKVQQAESISEINELLDGESVVWQSHARCLRHPFKSGGCPISADSDIDSHLNCSFWSNKFKTMKARGQVSFQLHTVLLSQLRT